MAHRNSSMNGLPPPPDDFGYEHFGRHRYDDSVTPYNTEESDSEGSVTGPTKLYQKHAAKGIFTPFGRNYRNLYEAFNPTHGTAMPAVTPSLPTSAPEELLDTEHSSHRNESTQSAGTTLPKSTSMVPRQVSAARQVPSKRRASEITEASKRIKLDSPADSGSADDRKSSPRGVARIINKVDPAPKVKGSGLWRRNNWAYVSDEDEASKNGEKILLEAQQISALAESSDQAPIKMTRRQARDLKSRFGGTNPATTPVSSQRPAYATQPTQSHIETSTRASRRSSKAVVNYSESNDYEEVDNPSMLPPKMRTPSTLDSPVSHGSTPAPGQATRSTSASTVPHQSDLSLAPLTKPKKTWNAIVYEVFINSTKEELTLTDVQEGVKELYPFFALPQNASVLESSPRNPLYNHPSFIKRTFEDKSVVWKLKSGDFVDKKSGKILSSGPDLVTPSARSRHPGASKSERTASTTPSNTPLQTPSASQYKVKRMRTLSRNEPTSSQGLSKADRPKAEEALSSRAVSREPPQEVPETQLPTEVPETQVPSSSPFEIMETQGSPVEDDAPGPQSREQRRLEGIVHKDLIESFQAGEIASFLDQTKIIYFKDMVLESSHIATILNSIFPNRDHMSSAADMTTCAKELQAAYDRRVWGSEWLQDLVKSEVTTFNTMNAGFLSWINISRAQRLNHWLSRSFWNPDICAQLLAPLADAVDVDRVWSSTHWRNFTQKAYQTACEALSMMPEEGNSEGLAGVLEAVRAALEDRFPDREGPVWVVPSVRAGSRNGSVVSSVGRAGSVGGAAGSKPASVVNTPVKAGFGGALAWGSPKGAIRR